MQPTSNNPATLALTLTELIHNSYLANTKHSAPNHRFFNLILKKDVNLGPLELLELSPCSEILAEHVNGQYTMDPFVDPELKHWVFGLSGEPLESLSQMKLPEGTMAIGLSYTMELSPRLVNADGSSGTEFDFVRKTFIRATTSVSADGTHWSSLTPDSNQSLQTQEFWNPIPVLMKDMFRRSMT